MYILKRAENNPIITPSPERQWEAVAFNACPIFNNKTRSVDLLYRAMGKPDNSIQPPTRISTIVHAVKNKTDNSKFERYDNRSQFITPSEPFDMYGCEDPRVTFFEGKYYTFYTALSGVPFNASNIKVAVAVSSTLDTVEEKHLVLPFNGKAMALFPERINGKIVVIFAAHTDEPPVKIALAQCYRIEELWDAAFWEEWHKHIDEHTLSLARTDTDFCEIGAVPIKTQYGWFLVYAHVQNYFNEHERIFGIEAVLLDTDNPQTITYRTRGPILVPEASYEFFGIVPNISFPSGAMITGDKLDIYYSGGDTVVCKASVSFSHLLHSMMTTDSVLTRFVGNPILTPIKSHAWESQLVFNPTAIDCDGVVYIVYRAMGDDNTSVMGLATSRDGVTVDERMTKPMYVPRADFELKHGDPHGNSGCEDARLTQFGETLYMTYTAYTGVGHTRVALTSISLSDFLERKFSSWSEPKLITLQNVDEKDVALFPEMVNGKYLFLHRVSPMICLSSTNSSDFDEHTITHCIELFGPRKGTWESEKVGIAGTPIKTEHGWLLIYHAVSKEGAYSLGAALLDLKDPSVIIGRTVEPILKPEMEYEKVGLIPNVVFSCGAVVRGDTLFVYYGGADSVCAVATGSLSELLKILRPAALFENTETQPFTNSFSKMHMSRRNHRPRG